MAGPSPATGGANFLCLPLGSATPCSVESPRDPPEEGLESAPPGRAPWTWNAAFGLRLMEQSKDRQRFHVS